MCLKHICHICNLKWKCVTAGRHQFQNWYWWLADTNFKIVIDGWRTPISKLILMAIWHQFQKCYWLLADTNFKLIWTAGRHQFQNWYWWLFDTNFKNVIDCWMTPISNWYKLLASTILRIELPLEFTVEQSCIFHFWMKTEHVAMTNHM